MPPVEPAPPSVPQSSPPPRRGGVAMPAWVAAILILLISGGLGYGAWSLLRPAPKVDLSQYEPARGGNRWAGGGGAAGRPDRPPRMNLPPQTEGVVVNPSGVGSARVAGLQVRFTNANGKPGVNDLTPRVTQPADNVAAAVRSFAINNAPRRTAAGVTDAQVVQLRQITLPPVVALTKDQQAVLLKAWADVKAADAAARPAAEKALLDAMKAIAQTRTDAATAVHAAAERIRGVLTPEQIATLQKVPPAATQKTKNLL